MRVDRTAAVVGLVMLSLVLVAGLPATSAIPVIDRDGVHGFPDLLDIVEAGDGSHAFADAVELASGDVYYGHLDRVGDRKDFFKVAAAQHQVVNVRVRVLGHDGIDEWVRPTVTTPPSPPSPVTASTCLNTYLYHTSSDDQPIDGAFNYYYVRSYVVNACAPVPGVNTYFVEVSMNWLWTPNNFTWDYRLDVDLAHVPGISPGAPVEAVIDLDARDTLWYKVSAEDGHEVNGSFEILNFDTGDPEERNVNVWVFPDDLGGYPRSTAWDWSSAPNEPVEPFSVLATYDGHYYIKLRGMNHESNLPCTVRLEVHVTPVPEFPEGGVQGARFDRHRHDTDWYRFDMRAGIPHDGKPGLWNEVRLFNMTERADTEDLPDFDLYLFGRIPGTRLVDLLDSSFRNDHEDFMSPDRDPNRNTEEVRAAALYNGTYYLEVNAFNNTGIYDLRMEVPSMVLSDDDNLPGQARRITSGVYDDHIHQALDHYDWYAIEANEFLRVQFDTYKLQDTFNVSIYRYDALDEEYTLLKGGWNVNFNHSSRQDELSNVIDVRVDLRELGLGWGTYHIAVFAAVGGQMATEPTTGRAYFYVMDRSAVANYELRVWGGGGGGGPETPHPIPDTVVDEDTSLTDHIDLLDHWWYLDAGETHRFKATVQSGRLDQLILQDDHLGFRAFPDYSGTVVVRILYIDDNYLQTPLRWRITFNPVNDAPRTVTPGPPYDFDMSEDSLATLDLDDLVYDVDKGDVLSATFDPPEHLDIELDPGTLRLSIAGAPDWFGEETVTFVVSDAEGASTEVTVVFRVANVEDAPVALLDIPDIGIDEDSSYVLDLSHHIRDPDGDALEVSVSSDINVEAEWDPSTWTLTLRPAPDWFGTRILWVTATDPAGHMVQLELFLDVRPVNDPPRIEAVQPVVGPVDMTEGDERTFSVLRVVDPDSHVLFYNWYVDGEFKGPSVTYVYRTGVLDQGPHEVTVVVVDELGASDLRTWTVEVEDVPLPPEGGIASPHQGGTFSEDQDIPFIAIYRDPDGDELGYEWYIDGSAVSSSSTFERGLDEGDHRVTLVVSAGDDTVEENLDISVVGEAGEASWAATAAVVATVAMVAVAVALVAVRARRGGRD